ncbi:MAG: transposase [Thermodesulfobacteriota bacterium]
MQATCGFAGCELLELNVQADPVHLVVMVPPKLAISKLMGRLKGQTARRLFHQFGFLKKKPCRGNHF